MINKEEKTYLTAIEAARYLGVARVTFYRQYKQGLQQYKIGRLRRIHYSVAQLEELGTVKPLAKNATHKLSDVEQVSEVRVVEKVVAQ